MGSGNLVCILPDGHIPVVVYGPHPCGGRYVMDAWVYGSRGRVGMWWRHGLSYDR